MRVCISKYIHISMCIFISIYNGLGLRVLGLGFSA